MDDDPNLNKIGKHEFLMTLGDMDDNNMFSDMDDLLFGAHPQHDPASPIKTNNYEHLYDRVKNCNSDYWDINSTYRFLICPGGTCDFHPRDYNDSSLDPQMNYVINNNNLKIEQNQGDICDGGGDTFKIALYTSSATLAASTTAYSSSNEASGTNYSAGGAALTNVTPTTSSTTALTDFADVTWSSSTITARGALIYKSGGTNPAVAVLDFGADKSSSSSTFKVAFPTASDTTAIIRIA